MTLIIRIDELTTEQLEEIGKSKVLESIKVHDAAVVMPNAQGHLAARDIAEHGRRCRRGADACDCGRTDRTDCFNWVLA